MTYKVLIVDDETATVFGLKALIENDEVEVLTADGYRVAGFTREDAAPITGDGLRLSVRWREKTLADLPAGNYCLRIFLQNAELYAATLLDHPI